MTMAVDVVRYRSPRARVAVAYSTKDRVELTRITVGPFLDDQTVDLFWFDGSATEAGQALPLALLSGRSSICELHRGVIGGPDSAIMYALSALQARGYELVVLIENDVLVSDGWYAALRASIDAAEADGFKVAGASARVLAERVLSFNDRYCLLLNAGAGFIALTPAAIDIVLTNYRTTHCAELVQLFHAATGLDVAATHGVSAQALCADYFYEAVLYAHGYVVTSPLVTMVSNVDPQNAAIFEAWQVKTPGDHLPARRDLITGPNQIVASQYGFFRFQKSLLSDRALIACHHLRVGINSNEPALPVRMNGTWRRRWSQGLGPFALFGDGQISVAMHGSTVGLALFARGRAANMRLSGCGGYSSSMVLEPNTIYELTLAAEIYQKEDAILDVVDGEIGFVGVSVNAHLIGHYANRRASLDHLPL